MHTHGIMFHHFHDETIHAKGQGSISAEDLELIIVSARKSLNLLNASEYTRKAKAGILSPSDITFTFDDALKCQYDIAAPVLKKHDVKAFFFVYSNIFGNEPNSLEYYRDFRNTFFSNIDSFYEKFFKEFREKCPSLNKKYEEHYPEDYLSPYPIYTESDRRFRFARDKILGNELYSDILDTMMEKAGYVKSDRRSTLFMTERNIASLHMEGHSIGLHSESHPMQMHLLDESTQKSEYQKNHRFLKKITGVNPDSMSHPCGNYNSSTLSVLNNLGISVGFRSNVDPQPMSNVEIPRQDHANVIREINEQGYYIR